MKNYSLKDFKKEDYIQNNLKNLNSVLVDGCLTRDGVKKLIKDEYFKIFGLSYLDVRHVNFLKLSKEDFDLLPFSETTIFPAEMPKFFDKEKILTFEKYNLNVDDGNVCMAIIDNPTQFYLHKFFKNKNIELVDYSRKDDITHFHTEWILTNIYKYAKNPKLIVYSIDWDNRSQSVLKALKNVRKRIKSGEKIYVVSISNLLIENGMSKCIKTRILKIVERLKHLGCEVVDSKRTSVLNFSVGDKPMFAKNELKNYRNYYNIPQRICMPVSRVVTEFASENNFAISGCGMSLVIPIVSYLYAYCKNINSNLTIEEFANLCEKTSIITKDGTKILNCEELLNSINLSFEQ